MFVKEESYLFQKEEEKEKKSPLERHTPVSKKTLKKSKRVVYRAATNGKNSKRRVK